MAMLKERERAIVFTKEELPSAIGVTEGLYVGKYKLSNLGGLKYPYVPFEHLRNTHGEIKGVFRPIDIGGRRGIIVRSVIEDLFRS